MDKYERLLDKTTKPNEKDIRGTVGGAIEAWDDLISFLNKNYVLTKETVFWGLKYGWAIRYRKGGRTLCYVFPEKDALTVLVVIGGKEAENIFSDLSRFSPAVRDLLQNTAPLHDGRWVYVRSETAAQNEDIKKLLTIKQKPKKQP